MIEPGSDELLESIDPEAFDKIDERLDNSDAALREEDMAIDAETHGLPEPGDDFPDPPPLEPLVETVSPEDPTKYM